MDPSQLRQIETVCQALYSGNSEDQRSAHQVLLPLISNPQCVGQLQSILANSQSVHALIFATTGLSKLISASWAQIPDHQKDDTRKFVLNYLYSQAPELLSQTSVILDNFVRLVVTIIKLSWLENIANQNIVPQVTQFLQASTAHWIVGLTLYTELTQEMQPTMGPQMARHRRTAMSFRETVLPEIFKVAIQTLHQFTAGALPLTDRLEEQTLLKKVLQLNRNCLAFDYQGTILDDTSDDQHTVMIPQSWAFLRQENLPKLFFHLYTLSCGAVPRRMDCARLALQCLVLVAALRRSFFTRDEERQNHLAQLISGTADIVQARLGLDDSHCYHELCRLLGKINAANQLSELASSQAFSSWIEQIFQFTMQSLEDWRHLPNSKHYILGLWYNMVPSISLLKDRAPPNLENLVQRVVIAFIESRMRLAEEIASKGDDTDLDDPLANEVMRSEQLEVISSLGRCKYQESAAYVVELFDKIHADAQIGGIDEATYQQKITWVVYIMGALIGDHALNKFVPLRSTSDEIEDEAVTPPHVIKGEIASKIFQLMSQTGQLAQTPESLELAFLYFLEQFRKIMQARVPERLAAALGLEEDDAVLGLVMNKLAFNLQKRAHIESVIRRSLSLFYELAAGINIVTSFDRLPHIIIFGKLLLKNAAVKYIMANHQADEFAFLMNPRYGKYRTTYYCILTKLLMMEPPGKFAEFMQPFTEGFAVLWEAWSRGPQEFRDPKLKPILIHVLRDLRGICQALTSTEGYMLLFSWLVNKPKNPAHSRIALFTGAASVWWDDPDVSIPLLKMMSEFVFNKGQRISFEQSSPNGILLFREVSSILVTFGTRILDAFEEGGAASVYRYKYKPLALALEMFGRALSGNYTNFGVFEVYNDPALPNALRLGLLICLAIPQTELQAYLKLLSPYYCFVDLATRAFMAQVLELEPERLSQVMRCLEDGLCSFEAAVSAQCCSAVENIAKFFFEEKESEQPEGEAVRKFLNHSDSTKRILQLMFQLVISGELSSTWSMARPLLALILLHHEEFSFLKEQIASYHPPAKKMKVLKLFDDLMDGVESDFCCGNKDLFTRNLSNFVQAVRSMD